MIRSLPLPIGVLIVHLASTSAQANAPSDYRAPQTRTPQSPQTVPAPAAQTEAPVEVGTSILGPSLHLALGLRMKKAPDLDMYHSTIGGFKFSLFGLQAGPSLYLSFLAPGLQYQGDGLFVPSASPIIFYHSSGIGFSFDLFPVRKDRPGGPVGMSINVDLIRVGSLFSGS